MNSSERGTAASCDLQSEVESLQCLVEVPSVPIDRRSAPEDASPIRLTSTRADLFGAAPWSRRSSPIVGWRRGTTWNGYTLAVFDVHRESHGDDASSSRCAVRFGAVVADDHGGSTLAGLGAPDRFEIDEANLAPSHQVSPSDAVGSTDVAARSCAPTPSTHRSYASSELGRPVNMANRSMQRRRPGRQTLRCWRSDRGTRRRRRRRLTLDFHDSDADRW